MNDYDFDISGDPSSDSYESFSSVSPESIRDSIEAYQPTSLNYNLLFGLIFGFYFVNALCRFVRKSLSFKKGD